MATMAKTRNSRSTAMKTPRPSGEELILAFAEKNEWVPISF